MSNYNYARAKAIEASNIRRLEKAFGRIPNESGIYVFTRVDEESIKYAYIGQAKKILSRLAQHLSGYQHIDLSIKKHGLASEENAYGWSVHWELFPEKDLDEMERLFINKYARFGYQLRNKTAGGQDKGKRTIDEVKPQKGYYDGKKQGYEDARKFVANLFDKNLKAVINGKEGVLKSRALDKFNNFIKGEKEDEE